MAAVAPFAKETTTTTGTGAISLAGAVAGHQGIVAAIGTGNTAYFSETDGANWMTFIGTVTAGSPDTLTIVSIMNSSNAGSAVNWGAGSKDVFIIIPAERVIYADPSNATLVNVPNGGIPVAKLATQAAGTILGNFTGAAASPTASATPVLGVNATTMGTLGLANGATSGATTTVQPGNVTSATTITLPAVTGTLAILGANTFTGTQTFPDGTTIATAGITAGKAITMSPANFNVAISPTGTGTVTISPATAGTISNMAGSFTSLAASGTVTFADGATWSVSGLSDTGSYTTASTSVINVSPTWNFSTTGNGFSPINFAPIVVPTGASAGNVNGISLSVQAGVSAVNMTALRGINLNMTVGGGYTGTVASGTAININGPNVTGTQITAYAGISQQAVANGSGLTTGTVTNTGYNINPFTAVAGSGGTINNTGIAIAMATGTNIGTAINAGIVITGNGQTGGTTTNWAINSTSTANSQITGGLNSTPIGQATQAAGAFTSVVIGAGTGARTLVINGASSGTSNGAAVYFQNAGSTNTAIGNASAILGGAFDTTLLLYQGSGTGSVKAQVGSNVVGLFNSSGLSVSSGLANSVTLTGSATNPGAGTTGGNFLLSANAGAVLVSQANPALGWVDTSAGTNLTTFMAQNTSGVWQLSAWNDAIGAQTVAYRVARGTTYNVASHTRYTSISAGTAVQGEQLTAAGLNVGDGTYSSFAAAAPQGSLWVNYINAVGNTTTNGPILKAAGSDTNIFLTLSSKGTGGIFFDTGNVGRTQFEVLDNASGACYPTVSSGATLAQVNSNSGGIQIGSAGGTTFLSDSTIKFGTYTAGVTAQTGYVTITDSIGRSTKLLAA